MKKFSDFDAGVKFIVLLSLGIVLMLIIISVGVQLNNNRLIKEGYVQVISTYCSKTDTMTHWEKK